MSTRDEYRYNRLTWEEMNEAIGLQKLVILPTGSTEQHGKHLPLDRLLLAWNPCSGGRLVASPTKKHGDRRDIQFRQF